MKKLISIALLAAVFGLVACSTQKPVTPSDMPTVKHMKKHHRAGKLGVEKVEQDTAK